MPGAMPGVESDDHLQIMEFIAAVQLRCANQILLKHTYDWSPQWRAGSKLWLNYQIEPELVQLQTEVQSHYE